MLAFTYHTVDAASQDPTQLYDVKAGDTLWKVASKYGTTVEDLKITNGLPSNLIFVGQRLKVPKSYQVNAGDTLWKLSQAHDVSVQRIKSINKLSSNIIYIGQTLRIPPKKLEMEAQHILMTRDEFQDWLMNKAFTRNIVRLQMHHTWSPSYSHFNGSNHFTLLKGMQNYHMNEMGWNNIAQNITTFPDGRLAVSRPINQTPQGTIGSIANNGGILIENVGNFNKGNDQMTNAQKETIIFVNAMLSLKFGLSPSVNSITYHHWWDLNTGERVLDDSKGHSVKTCPGTGFFGGNTTDHAKQNFYPLVRERMKELRGGSL
ncbi:LysM peptidoglycan-binding domain-containing protein [Pontibacillus sp. HMF3514]|nr:LysM peptidoglycan-binding domain-containing protein [Pontibacillus sp. HMF3514]